nr:MAG TPA: hypothetical protein [Bacteriophage sp.]
MNETEKKQKLVEYINNMNADEIVALHNNYCEATNDLDSRIYSMWDLDDVLAGMTPTDILCMGFYGKFMPRHEYFWFDGSGNLSSADYISDMPIYASGIADYILSEEDSLENEEIQEILDDDEDDDEDNF